MKLSITKLLVLVFFFLMVSLLGLFVFTKRSQAACATKVACCCEHGCSADAECVLVGGVCTSNNLCGVNVCQTYYYDTCSTLCQNLGICDIAPSCWYKREEVRCCNTTPQSGCGTADPTPTPDPGGGGGGGGGGACNGVCVPPAANCGVYGYPGSGSGSCPGGQMCCQPYNQPPNSCNIYYIPPITMSPGESRLVTITIRAITWGIDYVRFGNRVPYFTFSPASISGTQWCSRGLLGTGVSTISTTITANAVTPAGGIQTAAIAGWNGWSTPHCSLDRCCNIGNCSTRYFTVTVLPPGPWWQAQDGDITTQGNLTSTIPGSCTGACLARLILDGTGGYPGVAAYNGSSYDFAAGASQGTVSSKGWLAQTGYGGRVYTYKHFASLIPGATTLNAIASDTILGGDLAGGGTASGDYVWYKRTGDLTINGDLTIAGSRRVVVFVDGGDVTLNGNITIANPGEGFFGIFVGQDIAGDKGNIVVGPAVTTLNGVFWNDSSFTTGLGSTQLTVTGAVAGGGISLQRDLAAGNSLTPAEFFVYDPTLAFTFPRELAMDRIVWREVSP